MPLKFKSIKVDVIESGASEIYKTIKDRYEVVLEDTNGVKNVVNVDVPHLTDNGSFLVNGQQKVIVNQIVRFPIFFPSINVARFESSYSVLKIHSKELTTGSYLIIFLGSYKIPLVMLLSYLYGLNSVLDEYKIKYSIS
jgi:DNA-directed RNA polymerase beta subunit